MRTYINQIFFGLSLILLMPIVTLAQAPTADVPTMTASDAPVESDEPMLIANVNFRDVSTSSEDGVTTINFKLVNSYGRQDTISYGVVFRSKATGELLSSITHPKHVSLEEGESQDLTFTYMVPTYLAETSDVLLASYTREGLPLAFELIETIPASKSAVTCTNKGDMVTCDVEEMANAEVVIREGSPQGAAVVNETVRIDSATEINLASLISSLSPGRYVASVQVRDNKTESVIGVYATDFSKVGDFAKIMSASPRILEGGKVEVVVYAEVGYSENTSPLSLKVDLGKCASEQSALFDAPVKTFVFDTTCAGGIAKTEIARGDTVLDTLEVSFGTAPAEEAAPTGTDETSPGGVPQSNPVNVGTLLVVTLVGILLLAVLLWYFVNRNKSDVSVQPPTMILFAFMLVGLMGWSQSVSAATFTIGGTPNYNTCITSPVGMSCAEPSDIPAPNMTGTVTVPDSVAQGSTYTVNYTISVTNSVNTRCSGVACTAGNTDVEVYDNLPALGFGNVGMHFVNFYNTLPAGYHGSTNNITRPLIHSKSQGVSGNFTRTAPSTGTQDVLTFLTQPIGPTNPVSSCSPTWCLTYPFSRRNATVTLVAPNAAPVASAGVNRTINQPTDTVTISGASATDSDGTVASRNWTLVSGPVVATITNGTTLTPTFSGMTAAGTYIYRLTVTDNNGATDADDIQVLVVAPASTCDWVTTAYLGMNTGNPGMHNTVRCSTPAPSDGSPNPTYCNSAAENGTLTVCCDTGADCYRYTCDFGGSCTAPSTAVDLNFQ